MFKKAITNLSGLFSRPQNSKPGITPAPKSEPMFDGEPLTTPRPESNTGFLDDHVLNYEDDEGNPVVLPHKRTEINYKTWLEIKRAVRSNDYKNQKQIAQAFKVSVLTVSLIGMSKNLADYRSRRTAASSRGKK